MHPTVLVPRVQALEAKVLTAQNQINSILKPGPTGQAPGATVKEWAEVNPYASVVSFPSGTTVPWTTVTLSGVIPYGAVRVMLDCYCRNDVNNNDDAQLQIRRDSGSTVRLALINRGVVGIYSGEGANQVEIPITPGLTFQWQIFSLTGGGFTMGEIRVTDWR